MEPSYYLEMEIEDGGNKIAQLQMLREKLMKAKDELEQSWLDSRPLIYELEKMQSKLESAKCRNNISATVLSNLECQLELTNKSIRSKIEEVTKMQTLVNEMTQGIEEIEEEMEQLKVERDENREVREQLREKSRLKKQTLRTLQLNLRAIRLESEAYSASAAEAHRILNVSRIDTVSLTQEEYNVLTKNAKEESALAEWRVLVSTEQRNAAEKSRDNIAKRLQLLKTNNGSSKRKTEAIDFSNQHTTPAEAEEYLTNTVVAADHAMNEQNGINGKTHQISQKRDGSLLTKIRLCLVQKCKCYLG